MHCRAQQFAGWLWGLSGLRNEAMNIEEIIARHLLRKEQPRPPSDDAKRKAFYASRAWRKLRYETLKRYGARCMTCGRTARDGVVIVCDHILPIKTHWHLRLEPSNIQVLCADDNLAKASADTTDWR